MNNNITFLQATTDSHLTDLVPVLQNSFLTVANDLHLTIENAPTNPAFITFNSLKASINRGLTMFTALKNHISIGCIGIEDSKKNSIFYIERVAILPEYRHNGFGKQLLDFAFNKIQQLGGKTVSIAVIEENSILKNWYIKYGFSEASLKTFDHLPFTVCFMKKDIF